VKWHRNIAKNFNRLSIGCTKVIDRQTIDGRATAYSERERDFTFAKNDIPNFTKFSVHVICSVTYTFTCSVLHCYALIMAALCNRAGHYIFVLWFLLSFFFSLLSFFLAYSQSLRIGCLPYFHMFEMCCMRLAKNTGHKKSPKNRYLRTVAQLYRAVSSQRRHIDNRKKLLNSNTFSTCLHNMVNFKPLTAEIGSLILGHHSKFQQVSRLGVITAPTSLTGGQPNFARCMAVSLAGTLYVHFVNSCP